MKVRTCGRWLWRRTIGSTVVGQGVDTLVFYPVAFLGTFSADLLVTVMLTTSLIKVKVEVLLTPDTYRGVSRYKRFESEDSYDRDTSFTPFSLAD
jgi:hypothetical protein